MEIRKVSSDALLALPREEPSEYLEFVGVQVAYKTVRGAIDIQRLSVKNLIIRYSSYKL